MMVVAQYEILKMTKKVEHDIQRVHGLGEMV